MTNNLIINLLPHVRSLPFLRRLSHLLAQGHEERLAGYCCRRDICDHNDSLIRGCLTTDISYSDNGQVMPLRSIPIDLSVDYELQGLASAIANELEKTGGERNSDIKYAVKQLRSMKSLDTDDREIVEANIRAVLSATGYILRTDKDLPSVRIRLNNLLKGLEGRYYFGR